MKIRIIITLLATFTLTACGNKEPQTATAPLQPTAAAPAASTKSAAPLSLADEAAANHLAAETAEHAAVNQKAEMEKLVGLIPTNGYVVICKARAGNGNLIPHGYAFINGYVFDGYGGEGTNRDLFNAERSDKYNKNGMVLTWQDDSSGAALVGQSAIKFEYHIDTKMLYYKIESLNEDHCDIKQNNNNF